METITETEFTELRREVEQQREVLNGLLERLEQSTVREAPHCEVETSVSRRRLLGMAGAAAAGAVGTVALAATPAGATHDLEDVGIDLTNTGTSTTVLSSGVSGSQTLQLGNTGAADVFTGALYAHSSNGGTGIVAEAASVTGTGTGLSAVGYGAGGAGVKAHAPFGNSLHLVSTDQTGSHVWFEPHDSVIGPPTFGAHVLGQFWLDNAGVLWQCMSPGTPGRWVRHSPLVLLAAPVRMYDSRVNAPVGPLAANAERAVAVTNGTTIPTGVLAVLVNLTAVNPSAKSFMAIFKDGITWPGHSNLNYSAGATISNNATSTVSSATPGKVKVRNGASTSHFIVDVFGYYL